MRRAAARAAPRRLKMLRRLRAPPGCTVAAACRMYLGRISVRPNVDLLRLRLRAAQTQSASLRECVRRYPICMTSVRRLAWAKARFTESAATLYELSPTCEHDCDGCTLLDLARWCASRTQAPHELRNMQWEIGIYSADPRVRWLLRERRARFT
jgi:hypothetical protein